MTQVWALNATPCRPRLWVKTILFTICWLSFAVGMVLWSAYKARHPGHNQLKERYHGKSHVRP